MNEWSDISVLVPTGDIDISSVPRLRSSIESLMDSGIVRILINCENVTFIDSTGVAFLLARARQFARAHGLLSLVNVSSNVMRFLQIARLVDALHASPRTRPEIPMLAPDASPRWSKSIVVCEGVDHLSAYRHRIAEMLSGLPMSENDRYDMSLAVGEALGNAYDHADDARGCTLALSAYDDRVIAVLRDSGCGYEISREDAPAVSEMRGRGIRLMRLLVDSVDIRRREDASGTVVRLVKLYKR